MNDRAKLLGLLNRHRPFDDHEAAMLARIIAFVVENERCFERSLEAGHITGSAWVVDIDRTHTLLTHHAKLDKWLQIGGHSDGDPDTVRVAFRELREESGLVDAALLSEGIFDVDAHVIPARGQEPEHIHYDIRLLLEADRSAPLHITDESHDLAWAPLSEVHRLNTDESVLRLVARTLKLFPASRSGSAAMNREIAY